MHGMTDAITHTHLIPAYLLAIPRWPMTSTVLTIASVFHFSEDIGSVCSVMLHIAILGAAVVHIPSAVAGTLVYLSSVHVPNHARRVDAHTNGAGNLVYMASVAGSMFGPRITQVPDVAQRIACVHIALHMFTVWTVPKCVSILHHRHHDDPTIGTQLIGCPPKCTPIFVDCRHHDRHPA